MKPGRRDGKFIKNLARATASLVLIVPLMFSLLSVDVKAATLNTSDAYVSSLLQTNSVESPIETVAFLLIAAGCGLSFLSAASAVSHKKNK